jgi:hypothetical protein
MAFDRKTFKDRLQDILGGAITHFYMVKVAELNGETRWVQHWLTELDRLINMDVVRILVSQTKGKWDKRKALKESVADIRAADQGYRRVAANYVAKVYRLKKIRTELPGGMEKEFHDMLDAAVEHALRPDTEL